MKKSDIKTGVIYAYRTSKYDNALPLVVLDTTKTYATGAPRFGNVPPGTPRWRPSVTREGKPIVSPSSGYLAAGRGGRAYISESMRGPITDAELAGLMSVTLDGALALRFDAPVAEDSPYRDLGVINPRFILSEWDEYTQKKQAIDELASDLAALAKAESDARVAAATQRVEALRALNLPGRLAQPVESKGFQYSEKDSVTPPTYSGNTATVHLTLAQIDALLSLIPDGATVPTDLDTEGDGWTLRKPEYDRDAQ